jgi:uncharacterized protein YndB with AHSA1/START domain
MTLEKFEPTNGGPWRYIHRDEDGNEYAFHGLHHEVTRPERLSARLNLKVYQNRDT